MKRKPNNTNLKERYRLLRNSLTSEIRRREKEFFSAQIEDAAGDQKQTWSVIRKIIGFNKVKSDFPTSIKKADQTITNDATEICSELNNFFVNVGRNLDDALPKSIGNPLANMIHSRSPDSLLLGPVTEFDVYIKLIKLKPNKSYGADGIHPRFIRSIRPKF